MVQIQRDPIRGRVEAMLLRYDWLAWIISGWVAFAAVRRLTRAP